VNPELPSALDEPIAAMLAKDQAARPANLEDALDAVARAAAEAGIAIEPVSAPRTGPGSGSRAAPSGGGGVRVITGPKEKLASPTYAEARTLQHPRAPDLKTLGASETDVSSQSSSKPSRASLVLGIVALLGVVLVLGLLLTYPRAPRPAHEATSRAVVTAAISPLPNPEARPAQVPAAAAAAPPARVELRISGAPAGAEVFLGAERLGPADGALQLPFGSQPIELKLVAPKFKPAVLTLTPDRNQTLVAPVLLPRRAGRPSGGAHKEYENPF
jgi:hypothetical protein